MPAGGSTWGTAATATVGANTPSPVADYPSGSSRPYFAAYWSFTAAETGTYTFDSEQTSPNTLDTWLDVYDGDAAPFATKITSSDDEGLNALSLTGPLVLNAGQTVVVALGLYGGGTPPDGAAYVLNITFAPVGDFLVLASWVGQFGPLVPVAWDGDRQHLYTSSTNNCRYSGVKTGLLEGVTERTTDTIAGYTGWAQTTTSNNSYPYPSSLNFVQPGIVLINNYVDALSKFQITAIRVEGGAITVLSNQDFPSTDYATTGWLRGQFSTPDNPQVFFYGSGSSGAVGEVWETTVGVDGSLSPFVSRGPVTFIGDFAGSAKYGALANDTRAINDRLAINYFGVIFDRQNPATLRRLTLSPPGGEFTTPAITHYANARTGPDRFYAVFRGNTVTNSDRLYRVVEYAVTGDGSTPVESGFWETPAPSVSVSFTPTVEFGVVVSQVIRTPASRRVWLDAMGTPQEFTEDPLLPPSWSVDSMVPTGPAGWIELSSDYYLEVVEKVPPPPPPPVPPVVEQFLVGWWDRTAGRIRRANDNTPIRVPPAYLREPRP